MNKQTDLSQILFPYGVNVKRGFLPTDDPMAVLPNEPPGDLSIFDEIGNELPKLLRNGTLEKEIRQLPVLDIVDVDRLAILDMRLLMVRLAFLAHGYVWEDWRNGNARQSLPANLAVPLRAIAYRFNFCPTLNYSNYALWNWKRKDPDGPIVPENLKLIQNFLGGESEEWFVVIHIAIELAAAPLVVACWEAGNAIASADDYALLSHLQTIKSSLLEINALMLRMTEHCDPREYFQFVRPYLYGWKDKKIFLNGMLYEGSTSSEDEHLAFPGETGAQSSIVPCLDRVFGITHESSELSEHLYEMLHVCTSRKQRNFVLALEKRPQLSADTVSSYGTDIENLYWDCRELLAAFRNTHLRYAADYIQKQAHGASKTPEYLGVIGSGNTQFMPSLKKHLDETGRK
jgi:indoleamine 2,3-dioxygenase